MRGMQVASSQRLAYSAVQSAKRSIKALHTVSTFDVDVTTAGSRQRACSGFGQHVGPGWDRHTVQYLPYEPAPYPVTWGRCGVSFEGPAFVRTLWPTWDKRAGSSVLDCTRPKPILDPRAKHEKARFKPDSQVVLRVGKNEFGPCAILTICGQPQGPAAPTLRRCLFPRFRCAPPSGRECSRWLTDRPEGGRPSVELGVNPIKTQGLLHSRGFSLRTLTSHLRLHYSVDTPPIRQYLVRSILPTTRRPPV